jgi:RHS repeat-associated protein
LASRSDIFEGSTDSFVHGSLNGIPDPEALAPILNLNSTVRYNAGGAGRTVAYTASNMTASISEGTANLALSYDPEHARILQSATIAGAVSTTTYLNDPASNVMTETVHITGKNTWKTYIVADGKIVGLRTTVNGQPAIDMKYFIHDHLGSIAVVTDGNPFLADGVTPNPAYATAIERDAYDAWGKARVAATGADDTSCLLPGQSVTTRGFTGQEEMPSVCLVNYNARIYDPALGKFMTPDDMIPDAYRGQDYNRYTYVGDNPLSYDDPTGHYANTNSPSLADLSAPVTHNPFSTLADPIGSVEELAALLRVIQHARAVGLTSDTASAAGLTSNSLQSPSTATSPGGGTNTGNTSAGDAGDPMASSPQAQQASDIATTQVAETKNYNMSGAIAPAVGYDGTSVQSAPPPVRGTIDFPFGGSVDALLMGATRSDGSVTVSGAANGQQYVLLASSGAPTGASGSPPASSSGNTNKTPSGGLPFVMDAASYNASEVGRPGFHGRTYDIDPIKIAGGPLPIGPSFSSNATLVPALRGLDSGSADLRFSFGAAQSGSPFFVQVWRVINVHP